MVRLFLLLGWSSLSLYMEAQEKINVPGADTPYAKSKIPPASSSVATLKSGILTGGFIDIVQHGQMQASARLFRLYIGEPGKFQMPVSVYTGVTANNLSPHMKHSDQALSLINPGSGIFNMSFDGAFRLNGKTDRITHFQWQYQTGFRLLSMYDLFQFRNTNFFNWINGTGLMFITGAWETDKADNIGIYWINIRGLYSLNPRDVLNRLFGGYTVRNIWGYSLGMGIEISKTLNIKLFYFRFLSNSSKEDFARPLMQLSANYSVK
jgi:hypothetical protein